MDLYVLNRNLEIIGVLDNYTSLIWAKRYNAIGACDIQVRADANAVQMLQKGFYVLRSDDDMICRIEALELDTDVENGNFLIVGGYDCKKLLNQRIIWKQTNFTGTAEDFIRKIITENVMSPVADTGLEASFRKIDNFRLGQKKNYDDPVVIQSSYAYLDQKISSICETFGYGYKVSFQSGYFVFDLFKGTDRSYSQTENNYVVFSPEFENINTSKYLLDSSTYRSMALIAGEGEGNRRQKALYKLNDARGVDRYELFVDAKDLSASVDYSTLIESYPSGQIEVVSEDEVYYKVNGTRIAKLDKAVEPQNATLIGQPYIDLLEERGKEKLAEVATTTSFEGKVENNRSFKFGEDYFLGDIVTVENEYGIRANARITEVIETFDESGYSVQPKFDYKEVMQND